MPWVDRCGGNLVFGENKNNELQPFSGRPWMFFGRGFLVKKNS